MTSAKNFVGRSADFLVDSKIVHFAWYLLLVLIPVSTRVILTSAIRGFHEYETLFLYGSDLVLLLLLVIAFGLHRHHNGEWHERTLKVLIWPVLGLVISAGLSVFFAPSFMLAMYDFIRLLSLILLAWWLIPLLAKKTNLLRNSVIVLSALAVFEAIIAFLQFCFQRSLGLWFLGESKLDPILGLGAKVEFGGGLLRGYGTFAHPNILAAFLLIGLFGLIYLFIHSDWHLYRYDKEMSVGDNLKIFVSNHHFYGRMLISAGLFIVLLGLAVSFSRAGWLSGGLGLLVILLLLLVRRHFGSGLRLSAVLGLSCFAVYYLLSPVISVRAHFEASEPSVSYRMIYAKAGLSIVNQEPLGVGPGSQVLYSVRSGLYQEMGLARAWEWEPIHNIYLLASAEVGVAGGLSFLAFLIILLWQLFFRRLPLIKLFVLGSLVALLAFGLFDHFLWTIQAGKLMLWTIIGLTLALLLNPEHE